MNSTHKKDVNGVTIYEDDVVVYKNIGSDILHEGSVYEKSGIYYIRVRGLYPTKLNSDTIESIMVMKKIKVT